VLGTLAELAARHGGAVVGDGSRRLLAVAPLLTAGPNDLAPLTHPRYLSDLGASRAGAVLTDETLCERVQGRDAWVHPSPRVALAALLAALPPARPKRERAATGELVHPSAVVSGEARLGPGVRVGALAVVEAGAAIGEGTELGARCFVDEDVRLGSGCVVGPSASLLAGSIVGDRVRIGAGAVVGAEGFGFVPGDGDGLPMRVPQRGIVVIEDDVELGACSVVARATIGETVLRRGVKIDSLVQIGHNVEVGAGTMIAAQSGLAGSVRVGEAVLMGGQVGVADHIAIGSEARLAAKSGVTADVSAGDTVAGYPAIGHMEWLRAWSWLRREAGERRRR
jgi:UDP-3-O-[3-hydroxymyristoyl] glucosamine N-acyltransferase